MEEKEDGGKDDGREAREGVTEEEQQLVRGACSRPLAAGRFLERHAAALVALRLLGLQHAHHLLLEPAQVPRLVGRGALVPLDILPVNGDERR